VARRHLWRTIAAILWRHKNGAKWRAVPAELWPWWMAAQTFIRWSRLGVWERLLTMALESGITLSMAFLDGAPIRTHQKAAGARNKKVRQGRVAERGPSAGPAAVMARRRA
jgi:transposase